MDELIKIMNEDNIFVHVKIVPNGRVDKYVTVWGFDIVGLNEKMSSTIFTPHLWVEPYWNGKYHLIKHKNSYSSYQEALKAGIDYYYAKVKNI